MTGLEYDLTEKLCGSVIDKPIVVTFRPWRSHIIEYYFRDKSLAKLDVRLGIGKSDRKSELLLCFWIDFTENILAFSSLESYLS